MPQPPSVVRKEVSDALRFGRLTRLVSVEAQVFRLVDSTWVELTQEPIMVHLIHDQLEGVTKMLAEHRLKLIIDCVPVSSTFDIFTPSKKFIRFVCNKFDKSSTNYGFGFSDPAKLTLFHDQLMRIKSAAMASLTPSLYLSPVNGIPVNPIVQQSQNTKTQRRLFPHNSSGSMVNSKYPGTIDAPMSFLSSPQKLSMPLSQSCADFRLNDDFFDFSDRNESSDVNILSECEDKSSFESCNTTRNNNVFLDDDGYFPNLQMMPQFGMETPVVSPINASSPGLPKDGEESESGHLSRSEFGLEQFESSLHDLLASFNLSSEPMGNPAGAIGSPLKN